MTEAEFIDLLDCNFPYTDAESASLRIRQAGELSQNARYFVLHEILRAPPHIEPATRERLLQQWLHAYSTDPLFRLIERVLPAYRFGQTVAEDLILPRITQLRAYPGQIYALTLLVFASTPSAAIDAAYQTVLDDWRR